MPKNRTTVADIMAEPVRYGGCVATRAEVIEDLEASGLDEAAVNWWMFCLNQRMDREGPVTAEEQADALTLAEVRAEEKAQAKAHRDASGVPGLSWTERQAAERTACVAPRLFLTLQALADGGGSAADLQRESGFDLLTCLNLHGWFAAARAGLAGPLTSRLYFPAALRQVQPPGLTTGPGVLARVGLAAEA